MAPAHNRGYPTADPLKRWLSDRCAYRGQPHNRGYPTADPLKQADTPNPLLPSHHNAVTPTPAPSNPIDDHPFSVFVVHNRCYPPAPASKLLLADAPRGVKFARGENVKRPAGVFPNTRLGVEAVLIRAFTEAQAY